MTPVKIKITLYMDEITKSRDVNSSGKDDVVVIICYSIKYNNIVTASK